jgi:branched-chain amino acid transport system ATP-binding protein
MTLLALEHVTRRFGGLVAVDAVDLNVEQGGVTAIIGPNGAGKTTLFHMISGFQTPNEGRVIFAGEDITGTPPEKIAAHGLVRTFQLVQLFRDLTAVENVKVGCHLQTRGGFVTALVRPPSARQAEAQVEATARELLAFVGLEAHGDLPASALPYGQQRLLEIALALATRPKVLLLDEPAAGVPKDESAMLFGVIADLPENISVLFIEHDMNIVFSFATRIIVLVSGAVLLEAEPNVVRSDPRVREVYLGQAGHG